MSVMEIYWGRHLEIGDLANGQGHCEAPDEAVIFYFTELIWLFKSLSFLNIWLFVCMSVHACMPTSLCVCVCLCLLCVRFIEKNYL